MLMLMIGLLGVSAFFELIIYALPVKRVRKAAAALVLIMASFAAGGVAMARPNVCSALLLVLSSYRVINMLRIVEARMNEQYLGRATWRTTRWLVGLQLVVSGVWFGLDRHPVAVGVWWAALIWAQLVVAVMLVVSTTRNSLKTRPQLSKKHFSDGELPAVTIAIPARNEDEQLEKCLSSVLASDYPKLEVLVLDDCSQDKTAGVIRGFAHDGVRFIPGEQPQTDTWLAKNAAYARLAKEASGEIILFCGVDVRFSSSSIRELVTIMQAKEKTMMSIMPYSERSVISFVQSMRYFWEMALPRRMFNRPPVLSTCWFITAKQLKSAGGFAAVSRSIVPEAHFAREAIKQDGYRFMHSNARLGVTTVKSAAAQRETAIRTHYPQLHRRPEMVFAVAAAEVALLFGPFVLLLVGLSGEWGVYMQWVLAFTCSFLLASYQLVTALAYPKVGRVILPLFPFALLFDAALLQYSMWKYEFSEVIWKGRNVCIPVMRVIPRLPKLN